ncbi:MAG: SulP family inorganic anion transporter [Rhodospirillaceae bacterium]
MQFTATMLRGDAVRQTTVDIFSGLLLGFVSLNYSLTYGALIFSGALGPFAAQGIAAALLSAVLLGLIIAWRSTIPIAIAGPEANVAAVVCVMAASAATDLHARALPDAVVADTVLAAIAATSFVVGAFLYLLGRARRGRIVQFIPYPVMAGFLTGTGCMVIIGALRLATGEQAALAGAKALVDLPAAGLLAAAITLLAMFVLGRRLKKHWVFPVALFLGCASFYALLASSGISLAEARERGLLLAPLHSTHLPWLGTASSAARWDIILDYLPDMLAVAVVATLSILLNATGVGLAANMEVDFNAELRAAGLANVAASAVCGIPGYMSTGRTLLNFGAGATGRTSGIAAALFILVTLLALPDAISYFPVPVLFGLLLFIGIMLVVEWAGKSLRRLPRFEYLLLLSIAALIVAYGFVSAVLIGVIAACVLFVINYGRITCIKAEFSGEVRASKVERTIEEGQILRERGSLVFGLTLQGFLFFGTANYILNRVSERLLTPLRYLVLDLKMVQGLDASASVAFIKLAQLCSKNDTRIVLSGLSRDMHTLLTRSHAIAGDIRVHADVDEALEWVEDEIIASARAGTVAKPDLRSQLAVHFDERALEVLMSHMEAEAFEAGHHLFRRGDPGVCLYFIESGQVRVSIPTADGALLRLRAFGPGTMVGEMSLYAQLPRTADVVAERPTTVRKLAFEDVRRLETEDASVAIQFHHYVIRVLASRLAVSNEDFRSLL